MNIASILRHWFTLIATLFTAWIISLVALSPDDQAALAQAISELVGPLVIIASLVITALWRMALTWISNLRKGNHDDEVTDKRLGGSGGVMLLLVTGAAVGCLGALPSCSAVGYPVGVAVQGPGYSMSYQFSK
jgi:hypothetical protein